MVSVHVPWREHVPMYQGAGPGEWLDEKHVQLGGLARCHSRQ